MQSPLLPVLLITSWVGIHAIPLLKHNEIVDVNLEDKYTELKHLIHELGYSKEFADMVEINLKRTLREVKENPKLHGVEPDRLRQEGQEGQGSEEDDDEPTTPGITTPGPTGGDVVKGIAQIFQSLGTLDQNRFWGSFVNFFPPNQRESANALVEASFGRRPSKWPTLPTTTTKLTTTTKDEDEIDSEETTVAAVTTVAVAATTQATAGASVTAAPTAGSASAPVAPAVASPTVAATRAPVARYTIRPRTAAPDVGVVLRNNADVANEAATLLPLPLP